MGSAGTATSVSQIFISQPSTKRLRATTADNLAQSRKDVHKLKSNNKPNYLKLPDHVFKTLLSTSLANVENMVEMLDTPEKLQYTRDYAQLVNDLFYLRLKQDFWENYFKIATTTGIWSLQMTKEMIKENNLHRMKFMKQRKYSETSSDSH